MCPLAMTLNLIHSIQILFKLSVSTLFPKDEFLGLCQVNLFWTLDKFVQSPVVVATVLNAQQVLLVLP